MTEIRALIEEFRPHAKTRYYDLLSLYIEEFLFKEQIRFSISVDGIIEDIGTTRPTFYKYFSNLAGFYQEIVNIYFGILPAYIESMAKEYGPKDFLNILFRMRTGIVIRNLLGLSAILPNINPQLKAYYQNGVQKTSEWYQREFDMGAQEAVENARQVLNELIINGVHYYNDEKDYIALMRHQTFADLQEVNSSVKVNLP